MSTRPVIRTALLALLILGTVPPSWGWVRGRWGWHGGARIWIGAPGPWWWYPYPYYPYYYDYDPYYVYDPYYMSDPYDVPPQANNDAEQNVSQNASPDTTRHDLKFFNAQLARRRDALNFKYEDGDISKDQFTAGLRQLAEVEKKAHEEADANGGSLTADQENALLEDIGAPHQAMRSPSLTSPRQMASPSPTASSGHHDLLEVNDLLLELRTLLDQKLKDGQITRTQRDSEKAYLARIEKQMHTDANANGGYLTDQQQEYWVQTLHKSYYSINHNLMTH